MPLYSSTHRLCTGQEVSFGTVRITDPDFEDDAVILAETIEVLSDTIEMLCEEVEPLTSRVSCIKTKVQTFGDNLEAMNESILSSPEKKEVMQTFTYAALSSVCESEVSLRLEQTWSAMSSINQSAWRC